MWSFSIGFVHIKPLLFSLFLNRWLKSSTENVFFFLTSLSLVSPTNLLQSSELYGQVRSDFLFSSIKGKLCRIDDILDVFAKDAFFRFIIKSRVSRAAIDDVFSSLFLRPSVFVFFPLAISPGFYRKLRTKDRTLTRPRSEKEKIILISFAYCRR